MIKHIVLMWLKSSDEDGSVDFDTLAEWMGDLANIDVVRDIAIGTSMPADWSAEATPLASAAAIDSFDLGYVITLDSPGDVITFRDHPVHVRYSVPVREACRQIAAYYLEC